MLLGSGRGKPPSPLLMTSGPVSGAEGSNSSAASMRKQPHALSVVRWAQLAGTLCQEASRNTLNIQVVQFRQTDAHGRGTPGFGHHLDIPASQRASPLHPWVSLSLLAQYAEPNSFPSSAQGNACTGPGLIHSADPVICATGTEMPAPAARCRPGTVWLRRKDKGNNYAKGDLKRNSDPKEHFLFFSKISSPSVPWLA